MSLDTIFSGDLNIDDPQIRQALKNALPQLANDPELDQLQSLPAEYVKQKLIPALSKLNDAHKLEILIHDIQTSSALSALVQEYTFTNLRSGVKPVEKTTGEDVRSSLSGAFTTVGNFLKDLSWIQDENERIQTLSAEIIRRANRIGAKFDQYVLRGDGMQYGDDRDWNGFRDNEDNIYASVEDGSKLHNVVEDMSRDKFVTAINSMVAQARNGILQASFWGHVVSYATEEQKLGDILGRLWAIESWVDDVLPWLNQKGAEGVTKTAAGWILTWLSGFIDTVLSWPTLVVVWAGGLALHNTDKLAADSLLRKIPVAKSFLRAPKPPTPAGWVGAGAGVTTAAKTPRKYTEVWNRLSIAPNSTNHDEYARKMAKEIENLHAHPAPWAVAIDLNEAKRREKVFWEINTQYEKWKLSESEYLVKSEAAKKWHNPVAMYDDHGNLQYRASAKRLAVKLGEIPLGGTPFNLGTKSASESAIKKAQDRLKWTGISGVDLSGAKVDFPDMQTKAYYEQFHDQLKKYEQMQEWWEHDAKIKLEEQKLHDLNAIDKANIVNEIALKDAAIAAEPHNIPGAPMAVPGAAPIPTQIPNPARQTLVNERSLLTQELSRINGEISQQSRAITTLRWQMTAWRPSSAAIPAGGTLRDVFVAEVRAQKSRIEQTIIDTNVHIWGAAPAIRPWFFDPKFRKVDFNRLVTEFLGAVKK